jgi:hypothetical protein
MQQLFITSSTDGLVWSTPQQLTKADKRRLDPTAYEVSPNVFRVYYSTADSRMTETYTLRRGTLKIGTGSSASASATAKLGAACTKAGAKATVTIAKKKTTITCKSVKKKLVWSK